MKGNNLKKIFTGCAAVLMMASVGIGINNVRTSARHRVRTHRIYRHKHIHHNRKMNPRYHKSNFIPKRLRGDWRGKIKTYRNANDGKIEIKMNAGGFKESLSGEDRRSVYYKFKGIKRQHGHLVINAASKTDNPLSMPIRKDGRELIWQLPDKGYDVARLYK